MPIDAISLEGTIRRIESAVETRERLFISTPNSNFTVAAQEDVEFRRSVQLSDLVVPDGMPLVLFARALRLPTKGRVTGADMFEQLLVRATRPIKVYFFGGPDGAAGGAAERVNALGGMVRCVGFESPGFEPVEALSDERIIERINACAPDFVVVALGAKKGQAWIMRNRDRLNAPVISHLGAVINFTAGSVRRAPRWVQAVGAEWLWRIYQEPFLWRRYWNDGRVMLRLLLTVVVPELPGVWFHKATLGDHSIESWVHTREHRIALNGVWREADLHALSAALNVAIAAQASVSVDAGQLREIDARVTGALMLAEARVPRLSIFGACPSVMRQLKRHGADYLLA